MTIIDNLGSDYNPNEKQLENPFQRVIVLETLTDPAALATKYAHIKNNIIATLVGKIAKSGELNTLPRNSIIAQVVAGASNRSPAPSASIFFPFFSSHMCMPIKPGEHAWVMFEEYDRHIESRHGFWLSRIHEKYIVEDVNYTHNAHRDILPTPPVKAAERAGDRPKANSTAFASPQISADEDANTQIILTSIENAETEVVPGFIKRPGDLVIQGSHNTLVSLGEARASHYQFEKELGISTTKVRLPHAPGSTGEIDIVTGRGRSALTRVPVTYDKLGRFTADLTAPAKLSVGDPDHITDASRIIVSTFNNPDDLFKIKFEHDKINPSTVDGLHDKEHNSAFKGPDEDANTKAVGVATVAAMSDTIRLVARQNIKITVQGVDNQCGITITADGDIIIIPSKTGVIKLGGSDADRAILCTQMPVDSVKLTEGVIEPRGKNPRSGMPAIQTDMGGHIGDGLRVSKQNKDGSPHGDIAVDGGTFASKVLVVGLPYKGVVK